MKIKALFIITSYLLVAGLSAQTSHVILISIDGLHPDMYLEKSWPCPNLRYLMKEGSYANYLNSVFPSFTYPSHTAMITGAYPARSKINYNQPIGSKGEWYWYTKSIEVSTLWQVVKEKGMTTAAVQWPVSVGGEITWNFPEIWSIDHPDDRITESRKYATKGLIEEIEENATGRLDSTNFNDNYFSLDENAARAAAYIFKKKKPNFMAVHFATVDGNEHDYGRDGDSVRLALEACDRAIGDILQGIEQSGLKDSTAIIIVGDHGFASIREVMRPNILIKGVPARFIASGGSCFLYRYKNTGELTEQEIVKQVKDSLEKLPKEKRKLFRIIDRKELDEMGADSAALMALTGVNGSGLVFSGATTPAKITNQGAGTKIQQSPLDGVFYPTHGGHHGYDPNNEEMHTGFIAEGAGIIKGGHIDHLSEVDIAPLIARLLRVKFIVPDGKLQEKLLK